MGCHHGTVGGGLPAHHDGRAALAVEFLGGEQAADGQRGQQGEESFHGQIVCPKVRKIPEKSVLRVQCEIGPMRARKRPFHAKIPDFCVKCPFPAFSAAPKIGLPGRGVSDLDLKRLIFLENGSFPDVCGRTVRFVRMKINEESQKNAPSRMRLCPSVYLQFALLGN